MMAVPVEKGTDLTSGPPRALFSGNYWGLLGQMWPSYGIAPDGRFLMIEERSADSPLQLYVILNWFEELKRLAPAD